MAIIKPSLNFEGAETGLTQNKTPYLKESARKVVFDKNTNQQGTYLYFLPAYRVDSFGKGVWYKSFEIRDNFGDKYKEKYYVPNRDNDPAEYFARNFRTLYPEEAAVSKIQVNGKSFNKYPNFGRITRRNIFNVAYANNLDAGVYLLDLPAANGASQLHEWLAKTDIHGNARHPVNDPERAVPVFVQLKDSGANPWYINVEASQPVILPPQLSDSDNLYNLDEVLVVKSKDEIISKLRDMYPADIFDSCMDGFPGLVTRAARGNTFSQPAQTPAMVQSPAPMAAPAPAQDRQFGVPNTTVMAGSPLPPAVGSFGAVNPVPAAQVNLPVQGSGVPINTQVPAQAAPAQAFVDPSSLPPNPMVAGGRMTKEQAERFLSNQ